MAHNRRLRVEPLEDRRLLAITVDTPFDELDGSITDGDISLRDAIAAAAAGETIDFSITGTINLTMGELKIEKALTIAGPGPGALTINAQEKSRVINIDDPSTTQEEFNVTISGMTITRGKLVGQYESGGGILSQSYGELNLIDTTITGNHASRWVQYYNGYRYDNYGYGGGIFARKGSVTIANSIVSANSAGSGGGIHARDVTLVDTVLSNNEGGFSGGGIYANHTAVIRSQISGNAADVGGGIRADNVELRYSTVSNNGAVFTGGGVYAFDCDVFSSTISTNHANSGGGIFCDDIVLKNSTIANNHAGESGGGLSVSNHGSHFLTIQHSILSGNTTDGQGPNFRSSMGGTTAITSSDYNLVDDVTGISTEDLSRMGWPIVGNPLLGPLQDNGGPTWTHALLEGSSAINAGSLVFEGPPEFDQRGEGFNRVVSGRIDIGAFESQVVLPERRSLTVTTEVDVVDEFDYQTSLREAILYANSLPGKDLVDFDRQYFYGEGRIIDLIHGEFELTEAVTIAGTHLDAITIDAHNESRVFNITADSGDFELWSLRLTRGRSVGDNANTDDTTYSGGAVRSITNGTLQLSHCVIESSRTAGDYSMGGAVFATGPLNIDHTLLKSNSTFGHMAGGGAIAGLSRIDLESSEITKNATQGVVSHGGGIWGGGLVSMARSLVSANRTSDGSPDGRAGDGGGVYAYGTTLLLSSVISGNRTGDGPAHGGDPYTYLFDGLYAGRGGGVFSHRINSTLSTIAGNTTGNSRSIGGEGNYVSEYGGDGGGLFGVEVLLESSTVSGNRTGNGTGSGRGGDGGGVFAGSDLWMINSTISGNSTGNSDIGSGGDGGGIWVVGRIELLSSTIVGNSTGHGTDAAVSRGDGGGLNMHSSDTRIESTIITGNDDGSPSSDLWAFPWGQPKLLYSLIGKFEGVVTPDSVGNLYNLDPKLGPLQDNGGTTFTHLPLAGSPAIDRGHPNPTIHREFDQRGSGFPRDADGRMDIGAVEAPASTPPFADFDSDGDVDGRDFLAWQRNPSVGSLSDWQGQYGDSELLVASGEWRVEEGSEVGGQGIGSQELRVESQEAELDSRLRGNDGAGDSDGAEELDPGHALARLWLFAENDDNGGALDSRSPRQVFDLHGYDIREDPYVEQVDRALETISTLTPTLCRNWGEMVARRHFAKPQIVTED